MTTTPISAALNIAPSQPASTPRHAGAGATAPDTADRFSDVLTRQYRAHGATSGGSHSAVGEKNRQASSEDAAAANAQDADELALLAGAHSLGAAQIASQIAAQTSIAARPSSAAPVADDAGRAPGLSAGRGSMALAGMLSADDIASGAKTTPGDLAATRGATSAAAFHASTAVGREPLSSANRIPGQNPLSVDSGAGASDADGALLLNSRNAGKSAAALPARIQSTGLRGTAQPSESESLTVRSKAQITMASPFNTSSSGAPTMMKDATQTGDAINASFAATAAAGASISIVNAAGPLATAGPAIAAPLNSPQWPGEFGRQFIAIAQGAQGSGVDTPHSAELRLDPPELGPLRITININDNVAHAVFTSAHAAVRQTLENALPQLQQLLAQAGISLGQASVNDHSQPQSDPDAFAQADRQGVGGVARSADPGDTTVATTTRRNVAPNALIDTFA